MQYATHRMTFEPRQLQVDGENTMPRYVGPEPGANGAFGPGATTFVENAPGDPDLVVPAAARAEYEAAFARFARVFPDMFYMEERGRNYFDTRQDRGRYLDAGFHSLMGYFRDDQPLYELILDEGQQTELDALWIAIDFDGAATARMYQQWVENQTSQGGGRSRVVMPPNPAGDLATSEVAHQAVEAAFLAAAAPAPPTCPSILAPTARSAATSAGSTIACARWRRCTALPRRGTSTRSSPSPAGRIAGRSRHPSSRRFAPRMPPRARTVWTTRPPSARASSAS